MWTSRFTLKLIPFFKKWKQWYIDITKNQPVGENGLQVCVQRNAGRVWMFTFLLCPKTPKTINLRLKSEGESAQRKVPVGAQDRSWCPLGKRNTWPTKLRCHRTGDPPHSLLLRFTTAVRPGHSAHKKHCREIKPQPEHVTTSRAERVKRSLGVKCCVQKPEPRRQYSERPWSKASSTGLA